MLGQTWAMPPSTKTSLPVMKLLSSDARKSATAAVSLGAHASDWRLSDQARDQRILLSRLRQAIEKAGRGSIAPQRASPTGSPDRPRALDEDGLGSG